MKTLLLTTKTYPFKSVGRQEEMFVNAEVEYLANAFDRVVICATTACAGAEIEYRLPDNVEAYPLGVASDKLGKAELAVRGMLIGIVGNAREREALRTEKNLNLAHRFFRGYFVSRARADYEAIASLITSRHIHPVCLYSYWFYEAALSLAWMRGLCPDALVVSRAHRYDLYSERNRFGYIPVREYALRNVDYVLPCSDDGRRYLAERYPAYSSKIVTSYLGTQDMPDKSTETRGARFSILSCSNVIPVKRVHLIWHAIEKLLARGLDLTWTHYGGGEGIAELARMIDSSSVQSDAILLKGSVGHDELLDLYAQEHYDLFVNMSESEGLPVSIMEACSCGIPIVATDVGGTSEIVVPQENGVLLDADASADELAASIERFFRMDEESIRSYRISSRSIWEAKYRAASNYSEFARLLASLGHPRERHEA